ncbi:iron-containing redox enzyme family protein [Naasia sp. SYSU D00948]|uniref:iron-containing redox enzyme family protein n=1 Tax=Naasia sp. SYSU D00948 TaxID=2817379 RepID=UPI001B314AF2|nr:iron-containing redox enzyme family protein [Naasia sp. SYSU D00948]
MRIPEARGEASARLFSVLELAPGTPAANAARIEFAEAVRNVVAESPEIVRDEDLQLTLFCLYEFAYGGIDGVPDLEWDPALLATRAEIEAAFEAELRAVVPVPPRPEPTADAVARTLFDLTAPTSGPSLSRFVAKQATDEQLHEFLVQRSIYTLKEADPHSWAIPRLRGRAKAALVEIQSDEYGGGRPQRMHSAIFALAMRGAGLDDTYGRYVDNVPAITLAALNQMSMFGLHRRLRGAIVGHLAAFEMTSALPNRMYGNGFRRLGYDEDVTWYFDEHVEADAVHEQIAARDLAGGFVETEPDLLDDVLFGAAASLTVDGWAADHMREAWTAGRTSLRAPLAVAA